MIGTLKGRYAALHDNHKRIAAGALVIGGLTLVAKLFVALRELAIAWRYGISPIVDAYQLAVTITTWLPMLLTSAMAVVLVPRLVTLKMRGSGNRFVEELNGGILALGALVAALIWFAAPSVARLLGSTGSPKTIAMTVSMSVAMAPVALFTLTAGYLSARLQSRERFAYSVTEALPATVIALAVIVPLGLAGFIPLVVGTLIGYFLQLVVLTLMVSASDPPVGAIRIQHRSDEWSSFYGALVVMILGQIAMSVATPIDQGFASRIGAGAVATLGYANRIIALMTGAGAVVLARALLPVFSAAAAANDHAIGRRQATQWSFLLLAAGAVIAIIGWFLADWGVAIIFQRGAFTAQDSNAVAQVLRFGLLQIPFYFGGLALVQWIAAAGRYRVLLCIACVAIVVKIAMNILLVQFLGLAGIMASTALMYASSVALQYWYVRSGN